MKTYSTSHRKKLIKFCKNSNGAHKIEMPVGLLYFPNGKILNMTTGEWTQDK